MTEVPRIAVAGNQWITRYLIERLTAEGHPPRLVLNLEQHWSDRVSGYTDLAEDARAIAATLYRPSRYSLTSSDDRAFLERQEIDILLAFGWQRLIPEWLIDRARLGAFGVHGGPEQPPRCRGRAVFNWAILLGYDRFYMYAFRLTPHVDDGDIVGTTSFDILPSDDILTIYHKNCVVSTRLFVKIVRDIISGSLSSTRQATEGATYLPKREPEHGGIDWSQTSRRVVDLVRALARPYPGAFTHAVGRRLAIHRAQVFDNQITYDGRPGQIVDVFPNGDFVVKTGDGAVYVREWSSTEPPTFQIGMQLEIRSGVQIPDPVI